MKQIVENCLKIIICYLYQDLKRKNWAAVWDSLSHSQLNHVTKNNFHEYSGEVRKSLRELISKIEDEFKNANMISVAEYYDDISYELDRLKKIITQ